MSNLSPVAEAEPCASEPAPAPTLEALSGRLTDLGGLPIRRRLPRSRRRLVGPWCFLDSYGPLTFAADRALLLGGAPLGETVLMWWNFVARTTEEIVAAREDWEAGHRFGTVAYAGPRLPAPPFIARPVPRP